MKKIIIAALLTLAACADYDPVLDAPDAGADKGIITSPKAATPEADIVRPDCDLYPWDARCSPDGSGGGGGGGTGGGGYGGGTAPMTCTGGRIWVSGFGCASPYWGQHCTMNGQEFGCAYSVWGLCECFP